MTSIKTRLFRYRLPLLEALPRHASTNLYANGFIVALHASDGQVGYGELAEASLLSHESMDEAQKQLTHILTHGGIASKEHYAPVQWAMDSARMNLRLSQSGQSFAKLIGRETRPAVVLNALLDVSRGDLVDKGMRFFAEGYRTFKIKVGEGPLHTEISRIRELLSVLGTGVILRLDANRSFQLEQAVEMAHSLRKANIEYFEEPFNNLEAIPEFHALTGVKIALDESTLTSEFEKWCAHPAVSAYVVKPSRLGTIEEVLKVIRRAFELDRNFVVTSTFESGVGLTCLAHMASLWQGKPVAMGLATGRYFASDFLSPPLRPFRGQFMLQNLETALESLNLEASVDSQLIVECKI